MCQLLGFESESGGLSLTTQQRIILSLAFLFSLFVCPAVKADGEHIILRDLKMVPGSEIAGFDDEGVKLTSGEIIRWDQVLQGQVAGERQAEFEEKLKKLAEPLARIRTRLELRDGFELPELIDSVYPTYAGKISQTAWMLELGLAIGFIQRGEREKGLYSWLISERIANELKIPATHPWKNLLKLESDAGLPVSLVPIWFDSKSAGEVWKRIEEEKRLSEPISNREAYLHGSLALAAGDKAKATEFWSKLKELTPLEQELKTIFDAQLELAEGSPGAAYQKLLLKVDAMLPLASAMANYELGKFELRDPKNGDVGVLRLLQIPASYNSRFPELSSGALAVAIDYLKRQGRGAEAAKLEAEIRRKFPKTHYGRASK